MPNAEPFAYELNGAIINTNDPIVTGRDIRADGGLVPASDHILIELLDKTSRSVGLEEEINLSQGPARAFRSFQSDCAFSLTINERGYEWGAPEISAAEIRLIASIPPEHELILDSKRDRPIPDDGTVRLQPKGVERILSQAPAKVCIFVNTVDEWVQAGDITFATLAKLAFPDLTITPNTEFTVTFSKGPDSMPTGSLIQGEAITIKKGMIFDVTATDKS